MSDEENHRFQCVVPFSAEYLSQSSEKVNIRIQVSVNHAGPSTMDRQLEVEHHPNNSNGEEPLNLSIRVNEALNVQANINNVNGNNVWPMEEYHQYRAPTWNVDAPPTYDIQNYVSNYERPEPRMHSDGYNHEVPHFYEISNRDGERKHADDEYNAQNTRNMEYFHPAEYDGHAENYIAGEQYEGREENNIINYTNYNTSQQGYNEVVAHQDLPQLETSYVPVLMEAALNLSTHNRPCVPPPDYQEPVHANGNDLIIANYEEINQNAEEAEMNHIVEEDQAGAIIEDRPNFPQWNYYEHDMQERALPALDRPIQMEHVQEEVANMDARMQWNYCYNVQDRIPQPEMLQPLNIEDRMESLDESEHSIVSGSGSTCTVRVECREEMDADMMQDPHMHYEYGESMESGISAGSCSYFSSEAAAEYNYGNRQYFSDVEEPSSTVEDPVVPRPPPEPRNPRLRFICDCPDPYCRGGEQHDQEAQPQQQPRQEPPQQVVQIDEIVPESPEPVNSNQHS